MMKYSELERDAIEHFPNGSVEFDNQGQIVIYTGLRISGQDPKMETLIPLDEAEDDT